MKGQNKIKLTHLPSREVSISEGIESVSWQEFIVEYMEEEFEDFKVVISGNCITIYREEFQRSHHVDSDDIIENILQELLIFIDATALEFYKIKMIYNEEKKRGKS